MKVGFIVIGTPQQRGSKRGRPITRKDGRPGIAVPDDNPKSRPWMASVAHEAKRVFPGDVLTGPLRLTVVFTFLRRKGHFGTGRNADKLKPSAPVFHAQSPDLDKLVRCIADAMQGVLYRNDAQICEIDACRLWTRGGPEQAIVSIETLDDGHE